ncbi:protein still life, isoform SIF type 1 isoform X3 [Folsomia candida]|uniref:protein still life, isoform SIF type 1 isoform X3 n=1 Tax=Folsomia candida TaxID=158441 RepID=UPI001604E6AA|nr:protein still life, isoform SIF type 1 isoform X3 [Folsomia candida]
MGNKLSCNCGPLTRKPYRYEGEMQKDTPWSAGSSSRSFSKRDGHLLRLWAEVFHVTTAGGGSVKWQQVSEDLVPVNITCIQDSPEVVFHITAYNSQVDKILDVRLVQPGTKIGQASECFVYWKDPVTSDTWGLNFTSPIDAKQFRECCSPAFKFSRKASSSYSLKLENNARGGRGGTVSGSASRGGSGRINATSAAAARRRPLSTPTSPSKREPQCTCMTAEQYARLRAMDPRFRAASTLPRSLPNQAPRGEGAGREKQAPGDNYATIRRPEAKGVGPDMDGDDRTERIGSSRGRGSGRGGRDIMTSKSVDYSDNELAARDTIERKKSRSKSTDDVTERNGQPGGQPVSSSSSSRRGVLAQQQQQTEAHGHHHGAYSRSRTLPSKSTIGTNTTPTGDGLTDSQTLKRLLKPIPSAGSVVTSPEMSRRVYHHDGYISEPEIRHVSTHTTQGKRPTDTLRRIHERSRGVGTQTGYGKLKSETSPPSDHPIFDHAYYATTPPSSSPEDGAHGSPSPGSPTARLLLEYEQHLRNTLAKGMDAESYSLHTFEAIISQSNENLAVPPNSRSTTLPRFGLTRENFRCSRDVSKESRDSDVLSGYYSDFRDRGYLSDHNSRSSGFFDRHEGVRSGYFSDRERSGYFSDREAHAHHKYGMRQQASVESADSRLCYLTSSEISDDERMSLTTAVSDDEPGDGATSPKGSRKPAASFNCTGAVRKAGFLSVKKWLLRKRHQVELARRRGWKGYWVCLKGTTLLFYPCDAREARSVEAAPKHLIIVDGAIMQPIPEHPKRDYIFCLSTAFGDAYLFQAPCQVELESWVHSIHWACAAAFARHRGKTGTLHLLQEEIVRLDKAIESDGKLRHMAELQRSVVADIETRQQLAQQIANWEENIERLHCEQFRLRCYMASLQGGELPNPKSLLSHVSRTTKNTLNRLGVFTVSSFHAFVCARSPSLLSNLLAGRGATKRRAPLLSRSNSASSRRSLHASSSDRESEGRTAKISLPENQMVTVSLKDGMTVDEFLTCACGRKNLVATEHFVRVKKRRELPDTNYFVPFRSDLIETYVATHEVVEVRAKLLYQVELARASLDLMWGFSVEAELWENTDRQDELSCFVSRVEDRSVAMNNGIIKSDEILVINGAIVSDLDMMYIESVLQEESSLCLMLRSSRTEPPALAAALAAADAAIAQLVCPPPPLDPDLLTEAALSNLIVPAPHENKDLSPSDTDEIGGHTSGGEGRNSRMGASTDIDTLIKTAGDITTFCRTKERGGGGGGGRSHPQLTHQTTIGTDSPAAMISGGNSPTHSQLPMGTRDVEKMKKAVLELVETERAYVKHLTGLLELYLEPLRNENFLSTTEMMAIFGNIREMVGVQRRFLRSLEAALESSSAIESINQIQNPSEFKTILLNIASAFLSFVDHFKLYSSFCASHSKAQKLLHPVEGNQALQVFLAARNPKQQHSNTLESYLIKPIQRILKYPLLLQQIRNLCDTNAEEYRLVSESLQCMERVAEHINEMQRIHEEYGAIFEHLQRQHQKISKTPIDLSPGDLLHYGGVEWLNIAVFLGKIKKGLELHAMCFVFKTAVVFLCKERLRHKKKLISSTSKISDKSEVEIIRYQVLIPVSEVQVRQDPRDLKDLDSNGPNYSWELTHLRSSTPRRSEKTYLLSNSTAEFRNVFLRNIRQIIRESVRNMSLPPRLPSDGGDDEGDGGGDGSGRNGHLSSGGSHYATPEGHEYSEQSQQQHQQSRGGGGHGYRPHGHGQAHTLGRKKPPKPPQRHSAGNIEMGSATLKHQDSIDSNSGFRGRSKTMSDGKGGTDSEEGGAGSGGGHPHHREVIGSATMPRAKGVLGNTPNHLTLSTTSTISAGSTGSAAKLIHASGTPGSRNIAPPPVAVVPEPSSPIWKPRDGVFDTATLPRKPDSAEPQPSTSAAAAAASSSKTPPSSTKPEILPKPQRN